MNHLVRLIATTLGQSLRGSTHSARGSFNGDSRPYGLSGRLVSSPWEGLYLEERD